MSGPTYDDDDPTRADVRVRLAQQQGELSVRVYEDAVSDTVQSEITNKIVEAVAAWARDFNERNNVVGIRAGRHCKEFVLDASIIIEE